MNTEKFEKLQKEAVKGAGWVHPMLPKAFELRGEWARVRTLPDGAKYRHRHNGNTVIVSGATEKDGRRWLHVSVANPRQLPNWMWLLEIKRVFIGAGKEAIQVLPPELDHVNLHPNCLHLWHCVDGPVLPDFTHGTGSI